jgi:hypothetical protein
MLQISEARIVAVPNFYFTDGFFVNVGCMGREG